MQVEQWPIGRLHPYERHLRENDHAVGAVAAAITRFGFRVPILAKSDGTVIDGVLRLKAARRLSLDTVPVVCADDLDDAEVRAFRLSVNRLAEWDLDILALELQELSDIEISLDDVGFDDKFLAELLGPTDGPKPEPPAQISRADELGRKWGTASDQTWTIGRHRLLIADAADPANWQRLMGGERAACVFTDPPYGISYKSQSGKHARIANDDLSGDRLIAFLVRVFTNLSAHAARAAAWYVWHATFTRDEFSYALKAAGIAEHQTIVWVKAGHVLGRSNYHWAHEPCIYGARAGERPAWHGDRAQTTVWRVATHSEESLAVSIGPGVAVLDGKGSTLYLSETPPAGRKLRTVRLVDGRPLYLCRETSRSDAWEVGRDAKPDHPTQKPAELARIALENSTQPGDIVADAFLGGGCTMVGAEQTNRSCFGMELSPAFAGVILERMSEMGIAPVREDAP